MSLWLETKANILSKFTKQKAPVAGDEATDAQAAKK
jgi:hypothetical protein